MSRWSGEVIYSDERPDSALRFVSDLLSPIGGVRVYLSAPNTLTIEQSKIPGWAKVLAILLFPIGLVALLARRTTRLIISAEKVRGVGSRLQIDGEASGRLAREVDPMLTLLQEDVEPEAE